MKRETEGLPRAGGGVCRAQGCVSFPQLPSQCATSLVASNNGNMSSHSLGGWKCEVRCGWAGPFFASSSFGLWLGYLVPLGVPPASAPMSPGALPRVCVPSPFLRAHQPS